MSGILATNALHTTLPLSPYVPLFERVFNCLLHKRQQNGTITITVLRKNTHLSP
jgi:hypothetical protein